MKLYVAGIYDKYEGGCYARGVFASEEEAHNACTWLIKHTKFYEDDMHYVFHVIEYDLNNVSEFEDFKKMTTKTLKYMLNMEDNPFYNEEQRQAVETALADLE